MTNGAILSQALIWFPKVVGDKHEAVGVTVNLLSDENGKKIGKSTGGGALWIDKTMCSPFKMYQYLLSQNDSKIKELLYWFSFKDINEINDVLDKHFANPSKQIAQKFLANEVIENIFGFDELKQAQNITKILFDKSFDTGSLSVTDLGNNWTLFTGLPYKTRRFGN
nr:hypothetical protein [Mycoplasmopsis bovis]